MNLIKLILIILFPLQLMASHIVGGEMYYTCLGNNEYRVVIKVYRDCNSDGALFDAPIILGIFNKANNSLLRMEDVNYPGNTTLPVIFSNPCVSAPSNICVQEAVYSKIIKLPPLPEGYILAYERCCRGPEIINLYNPGQQGLTITAEIPGTNSGISCNSSPRFKNYPPLLLCNNEPLYFDHSATDPDGDELVYELSTPFNGGSNLDPMPNPTNNPPYSLINWENGFNATQPFGNSGPISINPTTGELIAAPDLIGKFVLGVRVKEYRNGVLIGSTQRDFLFIVFNCIINSKAKIVKQENLSNFESYCDGLTINFENESHGGSTYAWDFGVSGETNDTSSLAQPTYTFPSEGNYTVTLILNPGWACADTSIEVFNIYQSLNVSFDKPNPQCITNNSFDFFGLGDYKNGSTFNWEFGNYSNPNIATTENVNGVVFDTSGRFPITYTVFWNDCTAEYTDTIEVHRKPNIKFGVEPGLYCAPQKVVFKDSSIADAPIIYLWDFGDSNTSNKKNPSNIYENPGIYDVTLEIRTLIGCVETLTLTKPELIETFPSPVAAFSVYPEMLTIFNSEVTITDESIDSDQHYYQLTSEIDTTARNLNFHFIESGSHSIYQTVTNEYGCKDMAVRRVFMEPYTTLYVPTAFTPDGNQLNDVFLPVVHDVTNYQFTIYNRWGEVFFKTNNTKEGWNGRLKGHPSPNGVYIWKIEYENHHSIDEIHQGSFSLLR